MKKVHIENKLEVYTGQISFTLFHLFGIWKPLTWKSFWKTWMYRLYSSIMITIYFTFTLSLLMYVVRVSKDIDGFTENFYFFLCALVIFIKQITIMSKRKAVIESKNKLLDKLCQPQDFHETEILERCSHICRFNMIIFLLLFNLTGASIILNPLIRRSKELPLQAWYPFNFELKLVFWTLYLYQMVALIMAACTSASVEGLALALLLQICAQLDIIVHRLQLLPQLRKINESEWSIYKRESKVISNCVKHHIYMYSLGQTLNEIFGLVVFFQFFTSMMSLCALIYQLSRLNSQSPTYWIMVISISSVTMQIFLYCFYGEKIMEKSTAVAESVYLTNWVPLTNRTKKDLILMMVRATKPIQLTGSTAIVMSIKTFVKIMKSAYSAYNLLVNTY